MILLDVMLKGSYVCQLKYTEKPSRFIMGGEIVTAYNMKDLEEFVYSQRPSLRGKDININFSSQRV